MIAASLLYAAPAHASEHAAAGGASQSMEALVTSVKPESVSELVHELDASRLPASFTVESGVAVREYRVGSGVTVIVPEVLGDSQHGPLSSSLIAAGYDKRRGVYISFNKTDQTALASGAGAALGAAICFAGPVACGIAATVIAVALVYINDRGLCAGNRELRIDTATLRGRCV
ncbi:hypothetical protein [Clavibacter nebraskensis]|uniref:Integral membrane protein n=1 Tax=Clavibacter nebraskensis TaxID=31963 RepID=A0ABY4MRG3_9MICO|nr:hypothetical protein [Clavibacter nebraskensis]UQB05749.1 hypothetical protein LIV34_000829 [Clavibacter nebraskensis]